jgi:5-oxoprolinase (ATP-hydrolysing)
VRDDLRPGDVLAGPGHHRRAQRHHRRRARLARPRSARATTWCSSAWRRARSAMRPAPQVDPVLLEVFNNLFMNIAEQMGLQLQNTAYSVNIKERLDFSCALFDARAT